MKRFRNRPAPEPPAAVDLSAMIDMVFILLIFFIVTTTFTREAGVSVRRPASAQAAGVGTGFVPVDEDRPVTGDGDGRPIAPDDQGAIAAAMGRAGVRQVVLQADRQAPVGLALRVQDTCVAAGAARVDVAARRR